MTGSALVESEQVLLTEVRRIADEVAAASAESVDRDARFPSETIDALRGARALGMAIPESMGGDGASLETIARCCFELGRRCSSSAGGRGRSPPPTGASRSSCTSPSR